jgi:hypothetical protein
MVLACFGEPMCLPRPTTSLSLAAGAWNTSLWPVAAAAAVRTLLQLRAVAAAVEY